MDDESLCVPEGLTKKYFKAAAVLISIIIGGLYFYAIREQIQSDKNHTSDQCPSELKTVQHQLDDVKEYKNRMERLLTETQKSQDTDRQRLKIVMQSCFAMSQQSFMCQNQFNRAQIKCNKIRADYGRVSKELQLLKDKKPS
ncbi:uncharacterized protein LOC115455239 [Manduca sexta]|uniref:uncharacterized protein LOC115455239 n=1 Tax=Manduca sexta TaxID=7130 RepID=UPI00188F5CF5|nr:uncharacterized protein LOC115455239 [Manduca sexta]